MYVVADTALLFADITVAQMVVLALIALSMGVVTGVLVFSKVIRGGTGARTRDAIREARELREVHEQLTITNEELQTSKEEMESAIEELNVVNEDLKAQNQELAELNSRLEGLKRVHGQIMDSLPAAVLTVDRDLRLVSLNRACRKLAFWTGGKRDKGSSVSAVFHARVLYDAEFLKDVERILQNEGERIEKNLGFLDDNGVKSYYKFTVGPISAKTDESTGVDKSEGMSRQALVIIRDTSADRGLIEDLGLREELMRGLATAAPAAIVGIDAQGTVTFSNSSAEALFGLKAEEMVGSGIEERHLKDPDSAGMLDEISAAEGPEMKEITIVRKDGSNIPAMLSAAPLSGGNAGFVLVYSDAREFKRFQEDLRRESEIDKGQARTAKWEALNEISTGAAQEIDLLMAKIRAVTGSIKKAVKDEEPLEGLQRIELLLDEGSRSVKRIQNYISESPGICVSSANLDIAVEEALRRAGLRGPEIPGIDFSVSLSCHNLVRASLENIIECVRNVLTNALESMPNGGKLSVRTSATDFDALVEIQDSGTGMDRETLKKAFDPYFSTKDDENAGLGLTISRSILRKVEGDVSIESRKGKGTAVRIRFPLSEGPR